MVGVYERNVEVHGLVALLSTVWLHEAGTATFDLDLAACLLLDELDVIASATDNLCAQVKAANRLKTYGDLLFGPLALGIVSNMLAGIAWATYSAELVTLEVLGLPAAEATFVYEVRKVFLHHLLDHFHSLFQALLGGASDTEVQGRVLLRN
jgi:hypothetical protein